MAIVREAKPQLGLQQVGDKEPSCADQFLVYANYGSGRECMWAQAKQVLGRRVAGQAPENHEEE